MKTHALILTWLALPILVGIAIAAPPDVTAEAKGQKAFDESVDRGLAFLARSQAKDGSIGERNTPGITSLAIMAFLARGYTPGVPPYGDVINRGIDYILDIPDDKGTLMGNRGKMYSHTISCLMLSEVSGMVDPKRQARIDEVLPRALRIILAAQAVQKSDDQAGGWRYGPTSNDSDISLSGWALAALRSARNNGAPVPREAIDKAVKYILRCRTSEEGFAYQPGNGPNLARTGIGLLCLELAGRHRDQVTLKAGQYITTQFASNEPFKRDEFRYYAMYYMANGMFQLGGPEWEAFSPSLFNTVLKMQSDEGSWPTGGQENDRAYCTSMAVLTLSVSYRQLPIYQR